MAFVQPDQSTTTTNLLAYGPSGTGKTTFAGSANSRPVGEQPDVGILNTEGGGWQSILKLGYTPLVWDIATRDDITAAFAFLNAGEHGLKTVVLDSVTDLAQLLLDRIVEANPRRQRPAPGVPGKQDYLELSHTVAVMLRKFRDLNLNTILLARDKVVMQGEGENQQVTDVLPDVPGKLARALPALVDVSLYTAFIDVEPSPENPDGRRYVGQTVPAGMRHCKVRGAALPKIVDLEWRVIAEAYGRDEGRGISDEVRTRNLPPVAATVAATPPAADVVEDGLPQPCATCEGTGSTVVGGTEDACPTCLGTGEAS